MPSRTNLCLLLLLVISVNVCPSESRRKSQKVKSRFDQSEPSPTKDDHFDWLLIKHILGQDSQNVALSSFSTKFLLNMLYEGSSTDSLTQRELGDTLGRNPLNREPPQCAVVMNTLQRNPEQLLINSRVFADNMVIVSQKYATIVHMQYNSSIENVDFRQPEQAAETINQWVSDSTRGLIQNFVTSPNIRDSVMLLANTIYFKGLWANVFSPSATTSQPFNTSTGQTVQVPFMKQILYHYYAESENLKAKLLRLPYSDGRFSMILVLPNENSNMNELIGAITPQSINDAINSMEEIEVKIQLPRFRIEYDSSLKAGLQQLGINLIFQDNAELSGIFRGGQLTAKVSDVLQKTVLVVDEEGSTAGSASGSSLVFTIASEPENFTADRPFLFFIEEESTGTIVFAGKVENPAQ